MEITSEKIEQVTAVSIRGRMDAGTSKAAEEQILALIDSGEHRLAFDLAELDYISSVGLRVFMLAAKRLKNVDGMLVACALQPSVAEIFEIAGFDTLFAIVGSRDEAITRLG